jgi:hypothetical protein
VRADTAGGAPPTVGGLGDVGDDDDGVAAAATTAADACIDEPTADGRRTVGDDAGDIDAPALVGGGAALTAVLVGTIELGRLVGTGGPVGAAIGNRGARAATASAGMIGNARRPPNGFGLGGGGASVTRVHWCD